MFITRKVWLGLSWKALKLLTRKTSQHDQTVVCFEYFWRDSTQPRKGQVPQQPHHSLGNMAPLHCNHVVNEQPTKAGHQCLEINHHWGCSRRTSNQNWSRFPDEGIPVLNSSGRWASWCFSLRLRIIVNFSKFNIKEVRSGRLLSGQGITIAGWPESWCITRLSEDHENSAWVYLR